MNKYDNVCGHCNGKGTVYMVTFFDPDDVSADDCPPCGGKGGWDD